METRTKPTLKDVATAAGVSYTLASLIMRDRPGPGEQSRLRVKQVARDLGYQPDLRARQLRSGDTKTLGVVFYLQSAFQADLVTGIYKAARAARYEVVLSGWIDRESEEEAVRALIGYRCSAMLLLGQEISRSHLKALAEQIPVVMIGRRVPTTLADVVRTNDEVGVGQAVGHLIDLGHRDIAHVSGPGSKGADRQAAYRSAMVAHGLEDFVYVVPGGETVEAGAVAARLLLASDRRPTAVVAYDDDCAWGLIANLEEVGWAVPADLSVTGFDGGRFSRLLPNRLTTVRQDVEQLAAVAVQRAIARAAGEKPCRTEAVLDPVLLVGRSTTAPRAAS